LIGTVGKSAFGWLFSLLSKLNAAVQITQINDVFTVLAWTTPGAMTVVDGIKITKR
jgi:hypothetical protein